MRHTTAFRSLPIRTLIPDREDTNPSMYDPQTLRYLAATAKDPSTRKTALFLLNKLHGQSLAACR